jgi:hypothetical protein
MRFKLPFRIYLPVLVGVCLLAATGCSSEQDDDGDFGMPEPEDTEPLSDTERLDSDIARPDDIEDADKRDVDFAKEASIEVYLTDAPGDFDKVPVTITGVSIGDSVSQRKDADTEASETAEETSDTGQFEWFPLVTETQTHDLLALRDSERRLGNGQIPAQHYDSIRLSIGSAKVVVGGNESSLEIRDDGQPGFLMSGGFDVESGEDYRLVIDVDADDSIVRDENNYVMDPVLRVEAFDKLEDDTPSDTTADGIEEDAGAKDVSSRDSAADATRDSETTLDSTIDTLDSSSESDSSDTGSETDS